MGPIALSPRDKTVEPRNAAKLLNLRVPLACVHRHTSPTSKPWTGPCPGGIQKVGPASPCKVSNLLDWGAYSAHSLPSLYRDLTSSSPIEHLSCLHISGYLWIYVLSEAEKTPWGHWKLYKSTLKMFLNSSIIPLALQLNFLHTAGLQSRRTEYRCHRRRWRQQVFMLCNTYLGMMLMKAYGKEKWRGERNKINREDGYKWKIHGFKSNCLMPKITWV